MSRACAVLVTHDRGPLLREAVAAVRSQSHPLDHILVIDNASTDGSPAALAGEFPDVEVVALPRNLGSAGGYHLGIRRAFDLGYDWIWTLDDDSIPAPDALAALLEAHGSFPLGKQPFLLASKVVWTDGALHPMNIQKPKLYDAELQFLAASRATMSIRFTSFVSCLLHRRLVERHGLPVADYFIWNDDVEYTARMLRTEPGVLVPASVVVHETPKKHVPARSVGGKFYFEVRNKLWILRHSRAFDRGEKWWMAKSLAKRCWGYLKENGFGTDERNAIIRGLRHGLTRKPANDAPALDAGPASATTAKIAA